MKDPNSPTTRRRVLKTIGASAVVAGGSSVVLATQSSGVSAEKLHEQARRIVERTDDPSKRTRFLRNHGLTVNTVENSYSVSHGPSKQYLDESDLNIYLSMSELDSSQDKWSSFIQWNWKRQDIGDWGEGPWDRVGIVWDEEHYYFQDGIFSSNKTQLESADSAGSDAEGIHWSFNDPDGDGGESFYGEVYVYFDKDNVTEQRQIEGEYIHTYDTGDVDSVTFTLPDLIDIRWQDDGADTWSTSIQEQSGDPLIVSPDDQTA